MTRHLLILALSLATAAAQDPAGFRTRIDAYENAVRANTLRIIEAKTEDERATHRATIPDPRPTAAEVLALIHTHPTAPDLADGLNWLLTQCIHLPEGTAALDLIGKKYPSLPGIAPGLKHLETIEPTLADPVLQAVLDSPAQPDEKAAAHFALAGHHHRAFEAATDDTTRAAAREKATTHLQHIITTYPTVKIQGFPIADQAAALLFEITNLSVGAIAPDITGTDQHGQPFRLTDIKDRAILLIFWGDWCHGCHSLQPILAELAVQFKDQPLSIHGVNTDDPATAKKSLATTPFPYRNWLDGSTSGPITTEWNLHHFPTLYILGKDHRILAKDPPLPDLPNHLQKALSP